MDKNWISVDVWIRPVFPDSVTYDVYLLATLGFKIPFLRIFVAKNDFYWLADSRGCHQ